MNRKKATIHDIAKELNITASTVSRALNDHPRISDDTKLAVTRIAKELRYRPHNLAAALRSGKSNILGVIIPVADRNFFGSIVRGIEEIANHANYQVMICQTYEDPKKEAAAVQALMNSRVDGIIASLSKNTLDFSHFNKVIDEGIPLVLFDRYNDQLEISHVVIDDYQGAYKAVVHLIQQGCRRIAHFTNVQKISIYRERLRGYKAALQDYNIPFVPDYVIESDMQLLDGRRSMEKLLTLQEIPDGIFSSSDLGAMGALQVCKENNINIPQQIAIIGFSNEPFTMFSDPPLTSVDQHCKRMGNIASDIFLEETKLSGTEKFIPKKVVLMPELVIRKSSLRKS
ncbi:LacI family DNA-binding transcriptional regulator [Pseudochryseolinea flava]|uniref:LacI family transcriptional regulator n=1 Tax=Pseudochryseolinea flava TaxID=2059302 RepID=A0A364Y2F9_9BACT|nr:LacI family DNA-binding transcriptional regulator [Pseudochryseolinea flava]RAW00879.1 LacI family transcriptional regulator [Pseudochryseolinea flava]